MVGQLSSQVWRVKLRIRVRTVSVATPAGAEHHVATIDCALVHFSEMHSTEVDFEGSLITEGL